MKKYESYVQFYMTKKKKKKRKKMTKEKHIEPQKKSELHDHDNYWTRNPSTIKFFRNQIGEASIPHLWSDFSDPVVKY